MSILTRYIFKEMLAPTFLGLLFYTAIILMQNLFDMAGLIIRQSLPGAAVGRLLLFSLPHIIVLTVPMSLLFGILIAIGRLSSDSEVVAMRALGISTRTIYRPVFFFSLLMFVLNFYLVNEVLPKGNQRLQKFRLELTTSAAEQAVKPRVFFDKYEELMIYVDRVDPATGNWKGVFVADNRSDESADATSGAQIAANAAESDDDDVGALSQHGSGQRVIVAESGNLAVVENPGGAKNIWMNLTGAETHIWNPRRPENYDRTRNESQRILMPSNNLSFDAKSISKSFREMNLRELLEQERELRGARNASDRYARDIARVEIHKKIAIPFACIAFGILALPLGITNRRGGKSSGFSLSIVIILVYYLLFNNGEQLAVNGKIPAWLGMWGANILLLGAGIYFLGRANRDMVGGHSEGGLFRRLIHAVQQRFSRRTVAETPDEPALLSRLDITFPNTLDRYILREFIKVLALVLISVVALFVIIDYVDTSKDARENGIAASVVLTYYRFQIFGVLNWTLPISVLVATLVTFALMSKNNEVTAIKSSGVSLYRIGAPIVAVAAFLSVLAYLNLDFIVPYSASRASDLKRRIEGKPAVTAQAQQKSWYLGKGPYIINFLNYDREQQRLTQVQVFEFDRTKFRLTRRVFANRATWNGKAWVFEDGLMRSFRDDNTSTFSKIDRPLALFYPETPEDFATEVKPPEQMTYAQLRKYVNTLKASGYAAGNLEAKLYEKTSWPAICIVMALIAMPFAFRMGKRGALTGITMAIILGVVYWLIFAIFTKFGEVGNLPPLLSAWSANILFALAAVYMFLHVET